MIKYSKKKDILFIIATVFMIVFSMVMVTKTKTIDHISVSKNMFKQSITEININELFGEDVRNPKRENSNIDEFEKHNKENTNINNNMTSEERLKELEYQKKLRETKEKEKAEEDRLKNIVPDETKANLLNVKKQSSAQFERYKKEYNNSMVHALTAYILNLVRLASIPICALILVVSFIYQFAVGAKVKKIWNKGYMLRRITIIFFVAVQVLPFLFALIVKGWGN